MSNFVFAQPHWMYLLWAVAAYGVLLLWLDRRGGSALARFVSPVLQTLLVRRPGRIRRVTRLIALLLVGVFCTLALMRPQWGLRTVSTPQSGAEIMICLDVSRSMLAEDVAPSRLERAKAELRDLLSLLDGDRVGLIAFAGRASVLSPLTPDFGFLRLALDNASANSVRRGGTRLEEPIRKAIEAFGDSAEASRSILLITDGEDHDSFPLDAARDSAERGIRILAIGFGSESGSEIRISDPQTGARMSLRDSNGNLVMSRLDGSLLREMALLTDGAYIPAGTGVLDLESIYRAHIEPLTRRTRTELGQASRTERHDAYQLPLLLALLAMLLAVVCPLRTRREDSGPVGTRAPVRSNQQQTNTDTGRLVTMVPAAALLVTALALAPPGTHAANNDDDGPVSSSQSTGPQTMGQSPQPAKAADGPVVATDPESDSDAALGLPDDSRAAYNLGHRSLSQGDYPKAIERLGRVRERAGTDEPVRFSATYNLGWAEAMHAQSLLETEPDKALEHLRNAQEWFRRAIDLRPANEDARYNLETVQERLLALEDTLRKTQPQPLSSRLDSLIEAQRAFIASVREQAAESEQQVSAHLSEQARRANRRLAADQLSTLSQADEVNGAAAVEIEGLEKEQASQQDAKQQLRLAQLEAVLHHLHIARERLAQSRSQIRRNALQRGHRRAAAALDALKRSRDQLHDPVTRLDRLILDTRALAELTESAPDSSAAPDAQSKDHTPTAPAWLSQIYLQETQQRLNERTAELHDGLAAALRQQPEEPRPSQPGQSGPGLQPEKTDGTTAPAQFIEQLREAVPLIKQSLDKLQEADAALERKDNRKALSSQRQALAQLSAAREHFVDLRQLIELVYQTEQRIWGLLSGVTPKDTPDDSNKAQAAQLGKFTVELQTRNLERSARLGPMITDEGIRIQQQHPDTPMQPGAGAAGSGAASPQTQRLDQAYTLWGEAQQAMYTAEDKLSIWSERLAATGQYLMQVSPVQLREAATDSVQQVLVPISELRRLFFSLVEHLKDTAERQQDLIDRTGAIQAAADDDASQILKSKTAPLAMQQAQLSQLSAELSVALKEQATQTPAQTQDAPASTGASSPDPAAAGDHAQPAKADFEQAAKLVENATAHMQDAQHRLETDTFEPDPIRNDQNSALDALLKAVALIEPPNEGQNDKSGENDDQQAQQNQQKDDKAQSAENEQQRGDMDRLLQGVRDREAQRREAQARRQSGSGYETVEKDW